DREEKGHAKPGRPPNPDRTPPSPAKANMTDPDSRLMKTVGGFVQGYNAQAAVCASQVIVAAELTQDVNDVKQFVPLAQAALDNLAAVGVDSIDTMVADAGYWANANATCGLADTVLIATGKTRDVNRLDEPEAPLAAPTGADRRADVEAI